MSQVRSAGNAIAVIKVGGSILVNSKAYQRAATFIRNRHHAAPQERFVVVVSAQEGVTDALERTAKKISPAPNSTALDLLWATGELRSVALLVLHLQSLRVSAAALNVHGAGLTVPEEERGTSSVRLHPGQLLRALKSNPVAVVPGFFAADAADTIVSLGRGGSDLTAVLLAEGLQACRCELIKDVPGYFTSDPHSDPTARPVPHLTFEVALRLADEGCDLVQKKAIEAAARASLPLVVRSLKESGPITRITNHEAEATWEETIPTAGAAP
jgi:aspartate kinase